MVLSPWLIPDFQTETGDQPVGLGDWHGPKGSNVVWRETNEGFRRVDPKSNKTILTSQLRTNANPTNQRPTNALAID
eukprot:162711-Rhodomonas_salina.2